MKKYVVIIGICVVVSAVIVLLCCCFCKSRKSAREITSLCYESVYGYSATMEKRDNGALFSYFPSAGEEPVSKLWDNEKYSSAVALVHESGIEAASASAGDDSKGSTDKLTITYKNGKKRVVKRPESDDAFKNVRSCLMEFSGFCR